MRQFRIQLYIGTERRGAKDTDLPGNEVSMDKLTRAAIARSDVVGDATGT